jgi:hypothetical protein
MNISKRKVIAVATSALGLMAAAGPATAEVLARVTDSNNFTFNAGTPTLLATAGFNVNAGQTLAVSFSAECAVDAAAGNAGAWTDIDIQLVNSVGAVVNTLVPTAGSGDAFCTSNGTVGSDGWTTASMTTAHTFASSGTFSLRVVGRLNFGTNAWYGERALVVWR